MAPRGGYTSPENMRIILDVVKYLRASGFVIDAGRGNSQFIPPQSPIGIRNDTGVEIPPFACVQCTGTVEHGGNNWITVDYPADTTGAAGGYLFNGIAPIEIDGYGIAHDGPECRMLTDGSAIVCGDSWQPDIGAFEIVPGGSNFSAIGADDIGTDVMRGLIHRGESHYLYTLTSASAGTIRTMADDAEVDTAVDVIDTLGMFADQISGDRGICVLQNGVYYRIQAPCKT